MSHTDPVIPVYLKLSEVNLVLRALQELPMKYVAVAHKKIVEQAEAEVQRQNNFFQADPEPQQNVKIPAEPGEADSAPS